MSLDKAFVKTVMATCFAKLAGLGFKKRGSGIATIPITDGFTGWVGLNQETRRGDGLLHINVNVGLRYDPAHKLIAEIRGEKPHAYIPPTISCNVGYLIPGRDSYLHYEFAPDKAIEADTEALASTIERYGLPYMRENANVKSLVAQIAENALWDYSGELILTIKHLNGASDAELEKVRRERAAESKVRNYEDGDYLEFSQKLLRS